MIRYHMVEAFEDFGKRTASQGSGEFVNICNRSFPSSLEPLFQNESKCETIFHDFDLHENETACRIHFHMKGFALRLV